MPHSKALYRTFTNMEWVEDDNGNGGEDDNNIDEEMDHEIGDTNEHEDEPANDDVDFLEHIGYWMYLSILIQNVDIEVDSLARVDLVEDEIET